MARLIDFGSDARGKQRRRPHPAETNKDIRQSWVRQFAVGKSSMAIARQHNVKMRMVENTIREALWERMNAAA